MRVGLFGGSFNPPHMGHGLACYYLLETTPLDQIWLIPTYRHAFDKALAPFEHRVRMCELLAASLGNRVRVSRVERERGGISYTIDTVQYLIEHHPGHTFEWIIGADILPETPRWKAFDRLQSLVHFRVLGRAGYPGGTAVPMPNVSSTEIRRRIQARESIDGLVPRSVQAYLESHRLFLPDRDDRGTRAATQSTAGAPGTQDDGP